jgi:flagellar hook-associated protein 3 FlgL
MRVTVSSMYNQLTANVSDSTNNYQQLQQELSTGKQINEPSDNPSGESQVMTINGLLVDLGQYTTDANAANTSLQYTDSQLNSVQELMQQAQTVATTAANGGTQDSETQQANVAQINSIITQLTTLANSTYEGHYIFSGTKTSVAPYTAGDSTFTYHGNDQYMTSTIGQNTTVNTNVPGDQVFASAFTALTQLATDMTSNDSSAISNTDLPAVQASLSDVTQTRAGLGVTIDQLNDTVTRLNTVQTTYTGNLSNIQDVDIATVYAQLQVAQNVYQSSLVATSKAMQYSLADYL